MNEENKQYFDELEETYDDQRGHQLFAVDKVEKVRHYIDVENPAKVSSQWGCNESSITLQTGYDFPFTLRKTFESKEEFEGEANRLTKLINEVHMKEFHVRSPTGRYQRNR